MSILYPKNNGRASETVRILRISRNTVRRARTRVRFTAYSYELGFIFGLMFIVFTAF